MVKGIFAEKGPLYYFGFAEIASGRVILELYGTDCTDSCVLSAETSWSDAITTTGAIVPAAPGKVVDVDFDFGVGRTLILEGTMIINIPIIVTTSAVGSASAYAIAKLRKWDGSSETEIANNQSRTVARDPESAGTNADVVNDEVVVPKTIYKAGETIRLTIEIYSATGGGAAGSVGFAHDPKNRAIPGAATTVPSILYVHLPIKVVE